MLTAGAGGPVGIDTQIPGGDIDFVDFIDFQWFPIFNVADMAISCGAVALAISFWMEEAAEKKQLVNATAEGEAGGPP